MDTKKLRQKILDLAIHGKLVPQNPSDEPASVLLERIRAEKERLIAEGKIKRSKKSCANREQSQTCLNSAEMQPRLAEGKSAASDTSHYENVPFEVPEGWVWTTLQDISLLIEDCPHTTAPDEGCGYPLVRTPNIGEGYLILEGVHRVSEETYNKRNVRAVPQTDDIVYAIEAPAGNAAVIKKEEIICLGQRTVLIRPAKNYVDSNLLAYFILSPYSRNRLISKATGSTVQHVNMESIRPHLIPLPPYNEQLRIVDKIKNLFSLVDELAKSKITIHHAVNQAKSKILDLAIHGKLVPQDASDEPAIELLKRINPKFTPCDNPHYAEPYRLPHGWTWIELGKLAIDSADGPFGSNLKKEHYTTNNEVRIIQLSNIGENGWRDENTKYTTFEHLSEISRSEVKSGDIVIAKMMPAGRAILCPNSDLKYVLSSDAVKFVLPEGICNEYILNSINSSVFREQVYDNVQGVTRVRTSLQKLRTYVLPIPPYNEQLRIVEKVNELFSQLDMIEKSLQA